MGMEHWWNDSDRGKLKYWERNLSQWYITHHISHAFTDPKSSPGLRGGRPASKRKICLNEHAKIHILTNREHSISITKTNRLVQCCELMVLVSTQKARTKDTL